MKWNPILGMCLATVLFSSCEKSISFTPENSDPLLVVEASIESGQAPTVILSKSVNYFSKISPDILAGSFVRNAKVTMSNGTLTHTLKEYAVPNVNGYTLYYYSIDSSQLQTAFIGAFNTKYDLKIEVDGIVYTSSTTIPALTKTVDSLWWEPAPPSVDTPYVKLMARITDPPGFGNYIRYFTKKNNEPFYPGRNSVFDDQIVDGQTYNVQIDRGINRNDTTEDKNASYFKRGDTASFKHCNIDKATYDFWRTIEYSYASIGNPFSSPTKVLGNISNGALGYFGGYAVMVKTIVIPK